jgi:Helix-turn-helix domain
MSNFNTLPKHLKPRREKLFGLARGFPHDRNARVRIQAYVLAWNAKNKRDGQHQGPLTAAAQRVLHALLWHFASYKDGLCFPSYETIAEKARCCRDTVAEAIKALEDTGVFTWVNRIDRVAESVKDLFGHWTKAYRIVRRSNVYQFRDPLPCAERPDGSDSLRKSSKSENTSQHEIQELPSPMQTPKIIVLDPANDLDSALIRLGRACNAL